MRMWGGGVQPLQRDARSELEIVITRSSGRTQDGVYCLYDEGIYKKKRGNM